jgi:ankyrin repeat protein
METSLFGSAADLRSLLASGFNPNSATAKGTTALMMAVPDISKVTDLIEHGADINARSKTRYSALLVAALYPNGDASANFLLARGAQTRLPKGEGAPLFNATGIALAANSGNFKLIPIFAARGEKATEKYTYVGTFVGIPAVAAAQTDDTATMGAMLDAGLAVDTTDDDGLTLLDWGVISNRPNIVRLLLARGADVNHLDAFGMTPLHHAASIDFGSADMIAILRKAGARLDARTKDGVTALDLARKYRHQNLIRSLGGI